MGNILYRWWIGYVILRMRGKYVERLINLAVRAGLEIWDITRHREDHFHIKIRVKHFFKLKPYLRETKTRMNIEHKVGLPFVLYRFWRRKGLLVGFVLFFFILYMLSGLIWKVDVSGVESIHRSYVLQVAKELGIKKGAIKWKLDEVHLLQEKLQNRMEFASWVGLKIDGVVAKITIVEKVLPQQAENNSPRHLVAKKKAIVYKYTAERGAPKITRYQIVNPGDILISGIIGPEDDPSKQKAVAAKGSVLGETWYDSVISIPLKQEYERLTGNSKTNHYLLLGNFKLKLWGFSKKDDSTQYKQENVQSYIRIFGKQSPIGWEKEKRLEATLEQFQLDEAEAVQKALALSRMKLYDALGAGITIKEEKVLQQWVENGKVYIKVHYVVIEEITKVQYISNNP